MRSLAAAALVLALVGGCADEADPLAFVDEPSTLAPDVSGSSVLDAVEADNLAGYEGSRRELAALIVSPRSLGDELQLAALQVDDPNGTGRIDGRWYPPRVKFGDCSINVDMAPVPTAASAFIPGDPGAQLRDDPLEGQRAMLEASYTVSITVQVFDEASQRDGLVDTMHEFYGAFEELDCGTLSSDGDGLLGGLLGEIEEVEPFDTGYPAFGIESDGLTGRTRASLYSIGERVLLTVAITDAGVHRDRSDGRTPDPSLARRVIEAEIAQLDAQGFS